MYHTKLSEMEPILFGFGLFYYRIAIIMGDFIYHNSKEGSGLFFRVSHQTVGRGMMPKGAL